MNKNIIAIIVAVLIIGTAVMIVASQENGPADSGKELTEEEMVDLIDCFREEDVVIYGSYTCPACGELVELFGGEEIIEPIYVECMEQGQVCDEEKQTGYVPEIQIDGELYEGPGDPASLAREVGCEI